MRTDESTLPSCLTVANSRDTFLPFPTPISHLDPRPKLLDLPLFAAPLRFIDPIAFEIHHRDQPETSHAAVCRQPAAINQRIDGARRDTQLIGSFMSSQPVAQVFSRHNTSSLSVSCAYVNAVFKDLTSVSDCAIL